MHTELNQGQLYVTVDLLVLSVDGGKLQLFLARRVHPPYAGLWALPGRFVALDESAEGAARRLLDEMLPLPGIFLEQLYTFTEVNRDPRGRVISTAYLAVLPAGRLPPETETPLRPFSAEIREGELRLTGTDGTVLRAGDLAFDHGAIIGMGISRLRGKIDYTEIGFHFLEDRTRFTLGELQAVFEAVLGRPLDASNFRRAVLSRYEKNGRITQTDRMGKAGRGRPSALYRMTD